MGRQKPRVFPEPVRSLMRRSSRAKILLKVKYWTGKSALIPRAVSPLTVAAESSGKFLKSPGSSTATVFGGSPSPAGLGEGLLLAMRLLALELVVSRLPVSLLLWWVLWLPNWTMSVGGSTKKESKQTGKHEGRLFTFWVGFYAIVSFLCATRLARFTLAARRPRWIARVGIAGTASGFSATVSFLVAFLDVGAASASGVSRHLFTFSLILIRSVW